MTKKDKRIILIAQCLINPYCRVHVLGQNFPLSHELTDYLMSKRVGSYNTHARKQLLWGLSVIRKDVSSTIAHFSGTTAKNY